MKAVSKHKFKTIVEAPKGFTKAYLKKKAKEYIQGPFKIEEDDSKKV